MASRTFGTLKKNLYQDDYIYNKHHRTVFCKDLKCERPFTVAKQSDYIYIKRVQNSRFKNLNGDETSSGVFRVQDLNRVNPVQLVYSPNPKLYTCDSSFNPIPITADNTTFYKTYNIDPCGTLFGNTPCGLLNYTNFTKRI